MSELKPCPFCGESKLLYSGECGFRYDDDDNQIRLFRVHCRTCKGRTGLFESLDEAVEAWNRRTNSTTIQPPALGTNLAGVDTDVPDNNVGELISREQAIDAAIEAADDWDGGCNIGRQKRIEKYIRQLPSAQPDIIRCKDCKYWDTTWQNDYAPNYHYCPMIDSTRRNDFYCADAERRTDG